MNDVYIYLRIDPNICSYKYSVIVLKPLNQKELVHKHLKINTYCEHKQLLAMEAKIIIINPSLLSTLFSNKRIGFGY